MSSLFLKIFLWFWMTVIAIGVALAVLWNIEAEGSPTRQSLTRDAAALYAAMAVEAFESHGAADVARMHNELESSARIHAVLLAADKTPLVGTIPERTRPLIEAARANNQVQAEFTTATALVATALEGRSGRQYIWAAELPRAPTGPFRGSPAQIAVRLILALLISGVICFALARYLTTPILRLSAAAGQIAAGELKARTPAALARRRDELGRLVRDFNHMAEQIESLIRSQQQLLRDISHELRSPLARLNVALGLARQRAAEPAQPSLDRIELESERLNEMIGRLLTLARVEGATEPPQRARLSLSTLLEEIVDDARFEASQRRCTVQFSAPGNCEVYATAELLRSAIENVIRNAIRYSPEGAAVEVGMTCAAGGREPRVQIKVRDRGPGVPENELKDIFRPFYRVAQARERASGGAGIGLAITEAVIRLHGGAVGAENATGGGLQVTITLPQSLP
jgi:two-component system sensor histidine kinase CpxA